MNRVLIELYVPALNQTFDIYIPLILKIGEVEKLITNGLNDITKNKIMFNNTICLYNLATGKAYNKSLYVGECEIDNGSKIMLV